LTPLRGVDQPRPRRGSQVHTHNITTHTCEIDGDTAHCESYVLVCLLNHDGVTARVISGRYIDRLERRDGAWRIALRTNVIEWSGMVPTLPLPFADVPDIQGNGAPARSGDDPSYQRPLTNRRATHIPPGSED